MLCAGTDAVGNPSAIGFTVCDQQVNVVASNRGVENFQPKAFFFASNNH